MTVPMLQQSQPSAEPPTVPTTPPAGLGRGVTFGLKRPYAVNAKVRQFAGIAGDDSGSMSGAKAQAAAVAIQVFVDELAQPQNRDAFDVAVVIFDDHAEVRLPLAKATEAVGHLQGLDLMAGFGGSTNIHDGLIEMERLVDAALARPEVIQLRPVVVLFSDGGHNTGPSPEPVADRIKTKADLVTVAYDGGDEALLRRLASTPQHFYRCKDGRELRMFLAAVGKTLSTTIARGQRATQALGTVQ